MKRRKFHVLLYSGALFLLLAAGARGGETNTARDDLGNSSSEEKSAPRQIEPSPEEIEKILEFRELLELMDLLQDLDVLVQLEDKK